jgi:hypothetical protein
MPPGINVSCLRHPQRRGVARCMACQVVVCQECATRFEGINYCVACLAKTREVEVQRQGWLARGSTLLVVAATIPVTIAVLGWTVALWTRILH